MNMRFATLAMFVLATHSPLQAAASAYDAVVAEMNQIATANPDLATVIDVGVNDQGTTIYGLRIESSAPEANLASKPNHLVVGTHHGNEGLSVDVAVKFAVQLIAALKDPAAVLHEKLAASVFYVVPVLNVTGYNAGSREELFNGRWYDSNRDYPDPCSSDTPFRLASTRAIADFMEQQHIVGAVTIHGYIGTFTYPWGTYTNETHTPDHDIFQTIGRQSAAVNGYSTGTHKDVIYPTAGAYEDWAYYEHGIWVMLLELSRRSNVERDAAALLTYFSAVPPTRSTYHDHTGECTNALGPIIARP